MIEIQSLEFAVVDDLDNSCLGINAPDLNFI